MSKNTEEINSKQNKGVNKYVKSPLNYTGGKYHGKRSTGSFKGM